MLLNVMLFNSESWHVIKHTDIEVFEKVDQALLKCLTIGHSKKPIPALSSELGVQPLRFILASRRILYLHTIVTRDQKELTNKVYKAQVEDPTDGDFCELVKMDLKLLQINLS